MKASEARRRTEANLKADKEFQQYVEFTEHNIARAINNGERKCVLVRTRRLLSALIKHFENLGYEVRTNVPPYIETYYLYW